MINIGLKSSENKALDRLLCDAHRIAIKVQLLDLNHNYKADLSESFMDGAVPVDAHAEVTRALDLVLLDPAGKIHLDPFSASSTSVFIADMIRITYIVQDPERTKTYAIPVFTGPIDDVNREDYRLIIKGLGKEVIAANNAWEGKTYKEGQLKTEVIKDLLQQTGETRFDFVDRKAKLPHDLKLTKDKNPWAEAKKLAKSMGLILFYDGRGVCCLRERKRSPVLRLDEDWLTTMPKLDYDLNNVINAVRVIGKTKGRRGHRRKIKGKAVAKRRHPLSPWRLGRWTKPRYLWLEISDDSIGSKKEANQLARRELKQGLEAGVVVTADGVPHPRLQELDAVKFWLPKFKERAALSKFTIPLVAGDVASYGYLKRDRPKGGAKGARRKHKK